MDAYLKCTLFNWYCFHSILISSLWHRPYVFFAFWMPKISISIFIASFVFITKKFGWSIIILFLVDIWMLANLLYFRSSSTFIDVFAISMIGNMEGFWNSIWLYTSWKDSFIHDAFENAGATCSGVEAAYRALKKKGKINS